jgi:hypothetical protein
MEALIQAVVKALGVQGMTTARIHEAIIAKGWSEDDAFLAIKAGELLYKTIQEAEAAKKKPAFRRVP